MDTDCYRRWWLYKWVRSAYEPHSEFKFVTDVRWQGPPSGVYGDVELTFEDGTTDFIRKRSHSSFRPIKADIEVRGG